MTVLASGTFEGLQGPQLPAGNGQVVVTDPSGLTRQVALFGVGAVTNQPNQPLTGWYAVAGGPWAPFYGTPPGNVGAAPVASTPAPVVVAAPAAAPVPAAGTVFSYDPSTATIVQADGQGGTTATVVGAQFTVGQLLGMDLGGNAYYAANSVSGGPVTGVQIQASGGAYVPIAAPPVYLGDNNPAVNPPPQILAPTPAVSSNLTSTLPTTAQVAPPAPPALGTLIGYDADVEPVYADGQGGFCQTLQTLEDESNYSGSLIADVTLPNGDPAIEIADAPVFGSDGVSAYVPPAQIPTGPAYGTQVATDSTGAPFYADGYGGTWQYLQTVEDEQQYGGIALTADGVSQQGAPVVGQPTISAKALAIQLANPVSTPGLGTDTQGNVVRSDGYVLGTVTTTTGGVPVGVTWGGTVVDLATGITVAVVAGTTAGNAAQTAQAAGLGSAPIVTQNPDGTINAPAPVVAALPSVANANGGRGVPGITPGAVIVNGPGGQSVENLPGVTTVPAPSGGASSGLVVTATPESRTSLYIVLALLAAGGLVVLWVARNKV